MREYIVKTAKIGDSVVIMLPSDIVQAEQIKQDMLLKITIEKYQKTTQSKPKDDCSIGPYDPWKLLE